MTLDYEKLVEKWLLEPPKKQKTKSTDDFTLAFATIPFRKHTTLSLSTQKDFEKILATASDIVLIKLFQHNPSIACDAFASLCALGRNTLVTEIIDKKLVLVDNTLPALVSHNMDEQAMALLLNNDVSTSTLFQCLAIEVAKQIPGRVFEFILQDLRIDFAHRDNYILSRAALLGTAETVKRILQCNGVKECKSFNCAVENASQNSDGAILRLLLEQPNAKITRKTAYFAKMYDHLWLFQHPKCRNNILQPKIPALLYKASEAYERKQYGKSEEMLSLAVKSLQKKQHRPASLKLEGEDESDFDSDDEKFEFFLSE